MNAYRYLSDIPLAFDNLRAQKTRTVLTALGIVFGVGSVIGMLAIGAGAREESLSFIERLGVRNVLVESIPSASREEMQQRRRASPGLTERDVRILEANIESLGIALAASHAASGARATEAGTGHSEYVRSAAVLRHDSQLARGGRAIFFRTRKSGEHSGVRAGGSRESRLCWATVRARRGNTSRSTIRGCKWWGCWLRRFPRAKARAARATIAISSFIFRSTRFNIASGI